MKARAFAVVLALSSFACAQDAERAERSFRQGDFAAAAVEYANAADVDREHRGALCYCAGVSCLRAGRAAEAVAWFERALRRMDDRSLASHGRAVALQSLGLPADTQSEAPMRCGLALLALAASLSGIGLGMLASARSRNAIGIAAIVAAGGLACGVVCARQQFAAAPVLAVALLPVPLFASPDGEPMPSQSLVPGRVLVVLERRGEFVRVAEAAGWAREASVALVDER